MRRRLSFAFAAVAAAASAGDGALSLHANGEDLATEGFQAPRLTRDGWALSFERVLVTVADVAAFRTDPPFEGDGPAIDGPSIPFGAAATVDLAAPGPEGRVRVAAVAAPPGHYNALAWSLAPAESGPFAGFALVLEGEAVRGDDRVRFTLATRDRVDHACGEYVGDERKGFVEPGLEGDLEITLHLDHLFGRADLPPDDPMNAAALGFDPFAAGGLHEFSLAGLHVGHVGEGHCHATLR